MSGVAGHRRHLVAGFLLVAALVAWRFGGYSIEDRLGEIAIWAIFAMSLDVIAGYAGLVSLGHALYFGLGAYATAALTVYAHWPPALAIVPAVAAAALAAVVTGFVAVRVRGVFFIMITLAFGQMGWAYFVRSPTFGGVQGISAIPQIGIGALGLNLGDPSDFAIVAIVVAALAYLGLSRIAASPFGWMLVAIHQNEGRARALGLNVARTKIAAFTLAGAVAGLAGVLQTQRTGLVTPDMMVWTVSGEVLIMVIAGGIGTLLGPVIGAALWVILRHTLSALTDYWMLAMGLFFVAVVLFAGRGLFGLAAARIRRPVAAPAAAVEGD